MTTAKQMWATATSKVLDDMLHQLTQGNGDIAYNLTQLQRFRQATEERGNTSLVGYVFTIIALHHLYAGNPVESERAFSAAADIYRNLKDFPQLCI